MNGMGYAARKGRSDALMRAGMEAPMRLLKNVPIQAAVIFAFGVILGGGFVSAFAPRTSDVATTTRITTLCTSNDPVADFVCRNRWTGQHKYSYR